MKKLPLFILSLSVFSFLSCSNQKAKNPDKDIVLLFTSDVHCNLEGNLTYSNLSALKKEIAQETPYLKVADLGDAIQGEIIGTLSKGMLITEIMNATGYDYCAIGNHEFDFGLQSFSKVIENSHAKYLSSNIHYSGKNKNLLENIHPYVIEQFGEVKVAFIGVSSPLSIKSSTPSFFMEKGKFVYDFFEGKNGSRFYSNVQESVDNARREGADYVILLAHLGTSSDSTLEKYYSSEALIHHTKGIDAVLDSHDHNQTDNLKVYNLLGKQVILSGVKERFSQIGKLTISTEGVLSAETISEYNKKDLEVESVVADITGKIKNQLDTVITNIDFDLSIFDKNGIRISRTRETAIGNLCADAYRYITQADIGIINGGGIRDCLLAGDISSNDIISINPFNNKVCSRRVTGQQILDALEFGAKNVMNVTEKNGKAAGEFGGLLHVSGMRYTIDTSISSPIITDDKGMFIDIRGYRRVHDAEILRNGMYIPIKPDAYYTVGSSDYIIKNKGDGNTTLIAGNIILDDLMNDNQTLLFYINDVLEGNLSQYKNTEGRLTIK